MEKGKWRVYGNEAFIAVSPLLVGWIAYQIYNDFVRLIEEKMLGKKK